MKKSTTAWVGGLTAAAAAFLFWKNKGQTAPTPSNDLEAQLKVPKPARATTATRPLEDFRTPTPENGHVRDVVASNPPPDDAGSNFSVQGDVHKPGLTENNAK
ncbi:MULTISPECIES: hypothetical protein [Hymenobacter]|uniref:Uncharacterized protein n=1 Tax=Hymenobacter mucosus TaxID=1411120 RepID=A0A238XQE0_9BACT|nr:MULTISPECIES: hypothetical protein [Hymenobacter]SNR60902.1 hypothetical protein SAMN06269173_104285 [Hymenobacter mucosus]